MNSVAGVFLSRLESLSPEVLVQSATKKKRNTNVMDLAIVIIDGA